MSTFWLDRMLTHQAGTRAILGHERDTGIQRIARTPEPRHSSLDLDGTGIQPVDAEDRPHELAASAAEQAGDAHDLARVQVERHRRAAGHWPGRRLA